MESTPASVARLGALSFEHHARWLAILRIFLRDQFEPERGPVADMSIFKFLDVSSSFFEGVPGGKLRIESDVGWNQSYVENNQ
jgi:hypothetical protein